MLKCDTMPIRLPRPWRSQFLEHHRLSHRFRHNPRLHQLTPEWVRRELGFWCSFCLTLRSSIASDLHLRLMPSYSDEERVFFLGILSNFHRTPWSYQKWRQCCFSFLSLHLLFSGVPIRCQFRTVRRLLVSVIFWFWACPWQFHWHSPYSWFSSYPSLLEFYLRWACPSEFTDEARPNHSISIDLSVAQTHNGENRPQWWPLWSLIWTRSNIYLIPPQMVQWKLLRATPMDQGRTF